jgi:hypothetical protein
MAKDLIDLGQITRETLDQLDRGGRAESLPRSDQPTRGSAPEPPKPTARGSAETGDPAGPPQLHRSRSAGVPLEEAPEHFFDQHEWREFVSGCGSRQDALRRISYRENSSLVVLRRRVAEQPTVVGAKAREHEKIAHLGQRLVAGFLARVISGELVSTGMSPPSPARIQIPDELWLKLVPNFENGTAEGSRYFLTHIRIEAPSQVALTEPGMVKRIGAWLANRRAQRGNEMKKTLLHAARDEFAGDFTSRAFDAAYRDIYRRKRGRPRRPQG